MVMELVTVPTERAYVIQVGPDWDVMNLTVLVHQIVLVVVVAIPSIVKHRNVLIVFRDGWVPHVTNPVFMVIKNMAYVRVIIHVMRTAVVSWNVPAEENV